MDCGKGRNYVEGLGKNLMRQFGMRQFISIMPDTELFADQNYLGALPFWSVT